MIAVRQAEPRDAQAAADVLRRSITELCVLDHRDDADTLAKWLANKRPRNFLSWLASADNFCVIAEADRQVVGVGLVHRSGEIRLCYLAPGAQRKGIGKAIYLALEEQAKAWGLRTLRLESTVSARQFYEALGFRSAGVATPGFGISHCHPYGKQLQPNPLMQPTGRERRRLMRNVRVLQAMRPAYVIARFASLVGLVMVGMGLYGLYKLGFIEWAMTTGRAFDNPQYGNIKADEWRAGYKISMVMFISFGIAALVAAYGLFRGQRWAQYLWLLLVAIHMIAPAQELPSRLSAWIWLAASAAIFVASLLVFRSRRASAAP